MDKSLRIKANVLEDKVLNVNVTQDIKTLEILSLKLTQENVYKLHQSNYGVIIGRVLANDAFGIPNVKVSVFIKLADEDANNSEITNLYPYTSVQSFDKDYRKYNLLPDDSEDDCYRIVGTFPNKRLVLDNDTVLEVFDKYWKYTTVTNNAGDYMIFGVPSGNQELHVDVDLSDIGVLSQKPRDMLYKGYNIEQFDSANQFKDGTNLNNLSQIISQNQSVYVHPFWGDTTLGEIAISRCDISLDYKFETTCVFMGSLVTNNVNQQISHKCTPTKFCGFNRDLTAGEGTIEMIRKTIDGMLEDYQIKGNKLIDSDGVWCYQIPMNLDYVQTDEYGNVVPTDNPNKGIPTRARVRFRISLAEGSVEGASKHRAKYLVPNNPTLDNAQVEPHINKAGNVYEGYYEFGSATPENCFRNLYWNKVYTVKSFIPRLQTTNRKGTQLYTGIRSTNLSNNANPFPFNKLRFKVFFSYRIICLLLTFIVYIVTIINFAISAIDAIANIKIFGFKPFKGLCVGCIAFEGGLTDDADSNTVYYPGCNKNGLSCSDCPDSVPKCTKNGNTSDLVDTIQQNLAQEYDTVNLDFYNDWVNGCLYFPIWYWKKTKKKSYLFGLFKKKATNTFCNCKNKYPKLKNGYLCALARKFELNSEKPVFEANKYYNVNKSDGKIKKWDTYYRNYRNVKYGLIKEKTNAAGLNIYYYTCGNITDSSYETQYDASMPFVRLFATDIVLLGSFNDCDLDGIPKFFRTLPSTTANVPFLTKVTESALDADDDDVEEGSDKDNGTLVISGMDWLHTGAKQNPTYSAGLLLDLSCIGVDSRLKTNVNVERMSELGVSLDMSYTIPYSKDDKTLYETVSYPDGLITRYEINDNESRYMFAALNHLGLEEMVKDQTTNYDVYKLGAIYPMDFDGMLTTAYEYTKTSTQPAYDNFDANYVEFRLGANPHAYMEKKDDITYYPLYNNSYYFYFGLNDGNTAIDKFNAQYDANCYKTSKYPFRITYKTIPATWCHHVNELNKDYAQITVELSDISLPYSYVLKNSQGTVLFEENGMDSLTLRFGFENPTRPHGQKGYTNNRTIDIAPNEFMLNDTYTLIVTDSKRKSLAQIINVEPIGLEAQIEKTDLGAKYYGYNITHIEDICNKDGNYGEIFVKSIFVDGYEYYIEEIVNDIEVQPITNDLLPMGYKLKLLPVEDTIAKHEEEYVFLYFTVNGLTADTKNLSELDTQDIDKEEYTRYSHTPFIDTSDTTTSIGTFNLWLNNEQLPSQGDAFQRSRHNCGCQQEFFNEYEDREYELEHHLASEYIPTYEFNTTTHELKFNVWIPSFYTATIVQYCDGNLNDNIYNETFEIKNGKPFIATLDSMPVLFMMSGGTDYYNTETQARMDGTLNTVVGTNFTADTIDYSGKCEHYFFYDSPLFDNEYDEKFGGGNKYPYYLLSWFELNKLNMKSKGKDRNISFKTSGKTSTDLNDCLYYLPDYSKKENLEIYSDYIDTIETDSSTHEITDDGILTISQNLLSWVFELAKQTYSVDSNNSTHNFKCSGGKTPLLVRGFSPRYDILNEGQIPLTNQWYVDSLGSVTVDIDNPDIVGFNYSGTSYPYFKKEPTIYGKNDTYKGTKEYIDLEDTNSQYNSQYKDFPSAFFNYNVDTNAYDKTIKYSGDKGTKFYLSTYFAAFTRNGGFKEIEAKSGKYEYDESCQGVNQIPVSASVMSQFQPNIIDKEIGFFTDNKDVLGEGGEYPQCKSYFPAPFIDRRFDYNLMIFTMPDTSLKLLGTKNIEAETRKEDVELYIMSNNDKKTALITRMYHNSGYTYNGIEMSYDADDNYNIINGEISTSDTSVKLEYTHEDGKTEYFFNQNCIKDGNPCYPKFYETLFNGNVITDYFYSSFSNNAKNKKTNLGSDGKTRYDAQSYQSIDSITSITNIPNTYVLSGTPSLSENCNNIFGARNYPIVRGLNFLNKASKVIDFSNISCSYDITLTTTSVGEGEKKYNVLQSQMESGEEVEFGINPLRMISVPTTSISDACNLSDYNILYRHIQSKESAKHDDKVTRRDGGGTVDVTYNCNRWLSRASHHRLQYRVVTDDYNTTHSTLTCLLHTIQSEDAKVYEYLNGTNLEGFSNEDNNPPSNYTISMFTGLTYNNGVTHTTNKALIGKCGTGLLNDGSRNDVVLYKDGLPLLDNEEEALNMVYTITKPQEIEMINASNSIIGYDSKKCGALNVQKTYPYLAIGGIRKYVNLSDNLTKSIHLINIPKIYDIHDIKVDYCDTVFWGKTNDEQSKTDATYYTKIVTYICLDEFIKHSYVSKENIITSVLAKLMDTYDKNVYRCNRIEQDVVMTTEDNTETTSEKSVKHFYLKLKLYYFDLKITDKSRAPKLWQEIYLKMYNELIYCITYPMSKTSDTSPFTKVDKDKELPPEQPTSGGTTSQSTETNQGTSQPSTDEEGSRH